MFWSVAEPVAYLTGWYKTPLGVEPNIGLKGGVKLLSNINMFIARISSGRTVREFITAVLLAPTLVTIIWMSIYGGIAIDQVLNGVGALGTEGLTEVPLAMFQMFDQLPMSTLLSVIAILLILVFFITSSDSGSLVIDSITAGGKIDAPVPQHIFWASLARLLSSTHVA